MKMIMYDRIEKNSKDMIFECDIGWSYLLCQLIHTHTHTHTYILEKWESADTGDKYILCRTQKLYLPNLFHDPTAHYHLDVLRYTHIKNQVIWSSFTH